MIKKEKQKNKSRKHLTKARVISAEDVVQWQLAAVTKEQLFTERHGRMLEKKKAKKGKKPTRRGRLKHIWVLT